MRGGISVSPQFHWKDNTVLIQTHDRWEAAHTLLNQLLKDNTKYCNNCGIKEKEITTIPCCESPQWGTHLTHLQRVVEQNKTQKAENRNSLGTNESKTMRSCIAMPPQLFKLWCNGFELTYKEKLLRDNKDLHDLMKRFSFLTTCERI